MLDPLYLAGFFDGEGTITLTREHSTAEPDGWLCLRVTVCSTRPTVIQEIHNTFGGHYTVHPASQYRKQTLFRVTLCNRTGEQFLRLVLPFLVVQKAQALLALDVQWFKRSPGRYSVDEHGTRRLRAEVLAQESAFQEQLRLLNFPPPSAELGPQKE